MFFKTYTLVRFPAAGAGAHLCLLTAILLTHFTFQFTHCSLVVFVGRNVFSVCVTTYETILGT